MNCVSIDLLTCHIAEVMANKASKATPCSHQNGKKRFPHDDPNDKPPEVAPWRNNVTALSQNYNLYFVAYCDTIHIYQPQFPDQIVSKESRKINLPASRPDLQGYINPRRPQAANHIIVKDLGEEEILLIACDGGDVIGYFTRSIENALSKLVFSVTPFFHEYIGASAWGLDVHKSSRLIAVSSNSHEIIVFAFALADGTGDDETHEADMDQWDAAPFSQPITMSFLGASLSSLWQTPGKSSFSAFHHLSSHVKNPSYNALQSLFNVVKTIQALSLDLQTSKMWMNSEFKAYYKLRYKL